VECKVNRNVYLGFATVGALSAALLLAGCGRKGPLDPPPGGYVLQPSVGKTPVSKRGLQPGQRQESNGEEQPAVPEGPRRRTPLDWLLD
jgi:predicted small lipoprotein YifL